MLFSPTFDLSVAAVSQVEVTDALQQEVQRFLFREARTLDTRHFEDWLALWTPDGMYWVPHEPDQENARDHISLFWEDATLRDVRVRRITNARNWSQQPFTRTARTVSNVLIEGLDESGRLIVHSTLGVTEWRLDQRHLAGLTTHKLEVQSGADGARWKIYLKRIDLVNSRDTFANLEIFL
ncbi:aromatic-ring-hydroxylating dioxygenase subunit beta [Burkholderia sp. PAMC 26561]|uniref:aromatic-ring-hydroxylating dioxygenase subunit beta n=1 Tax=Burkholderia sp. PAMC 26561 TaxID=1795043 RepID=UPI00076B2BF4|nr:aromatic-ring-hydroxylating dioxygenase subunit beta [Burkholderia sp. PAMC 26561]AME28417.1 aromatic-ring-hydroxylating dioxygenase subunit beta [Burkholderia sp. PAMC 26561]